MWDDVYNTVYSISHDVKVNAGLIAMHTRTRRRLRVSPEAETLFQLNEMRLRAFFNQCMQYKIVDLGNMWVPLTAMPVKCNASEKRA